ncbi:MAG: AAA family ATPase [Paludibacteraceae bacterium]
MRVNPFIISGFVSQEYFCDREDELRSLKKNIDSKTNVTLVSPRRLGKSGLILRLFDDLKKSNDYICLYVDIFATRNHEDFIKVLSESIIREFPENTSVGEKFWNFLKGLRPLIRFDSVSGAPQIEITYQNEGEKQQTLRNIWQFLESQKKQVVVAIDEFQQVREYPQTNMEAILRTEIQHLHNVSFLFSGSKRSIMLDIFANTKKPFYQSTSFLNLEKIATEKYIGFIQNHFISAGYEIGEEDTAFILDWTEGFTYHTQKVCNRLFEERIPTIKREDILAVLDTLLTENNAQYTQIRELLTSAQWNYLIAVAKEGKIEQPTAQDFLMKYKIGASTNSRRILGALIEKDLILENIHMDGKNYQVYDVFFKHWLTKNY